MEFWEDDSRDRLVRRVKSDLETIEEALTSSI
ncbi:unnamed protein product [Protopolystoma xenopodis]|uniref:Uncharacterized protein n=1 Tax=Protopolystoma xenopodis TaxID=117903 RepID=A0A448WX86_9PLAT|nr:unnamed protein product [Protopolystoma xenopodis]